MSGDGVVAHNRRTYFAENVDPTRTRLNVEYCYTPIEEAYHQLFDAALAEFNAKQKRKDRCIENYYEKIRDGKQEKPFYEVIFQVGNKDDMGTVGENAELAKTILDKFYHSFLERNSHLHVYSAHLHMDEATPHLHIDFIPFTTGSKRGLSTRVSLKQALADQGITGEGRSLTERDLSDDKFIFNLMNFPKHSCFEMTNLFDILKKNYKLVEGVGESGGYHAQVFMSSLFSQMDFS